MLRMITIMAPFQIEDKCLCMWKVCLRLICVCWSNRAQTARCKCTSPSVFLVFLSPVSHSCGIQVHGDTARGGVPCGSRLPCSGGNALPVTEKRRTGGKRDGDRRKEREKACRGRAEERVWHTRSSPRNLSVS